MERKSDSRSNVSILRSISHGRIDQIQGAAKKSQKNELFNLTVLLRHFERKNVKLLQ